MKSISFFGASGTVTGSCYQLNRDNKASLLVDYGMYQGVKEIEKLNHVSIPYKPHELDGMLLTHAHLDHCGRLPLLLQHGFKNKLFMTEPTRDILEITLHDAARIAEKNETVMPLYTEDDVELLMGYIEIVDYNQPFELGGFEITYHDAGHILGSASIKIVDKQADDDIQSIVFSGDIGKWPHDLLPNPHLFDEADAVVMESTYGGRLHSNEDPLALIADEIHAIERSGGALLIPSFAIERTQEVLYLLKQLKDSGKIKAQTPVFLDSPMALHVTDVYKHYGALFNDEFHKVIMAGDPFTFEGLHKLEKNRQSRIIDKVMGPKVIIAGSGMMSGGRIMKHAVKYLPKESTRLLFVGYLGDETPGRIISEGAQTVKIMDFHVQVNAQIAKIDSLSAHADEKQLLEWLAHIKGVKHVFLTHGEDEARDALEPKIEQSGISRISKPQLNDEVLIKG